MVETLMKIDAQKILTALIISAIIGQARFDFQLSAAVARVETKLDGLNQNNQKQLTEKQTYER